MVSKAKKIKNNKRSLKHNAMKKQKLAKVNAGGAPPAPAPAPALESVPGPSQLVASVPLTNGGVAASKGKEKAKNKPERHSGFIFMCSTKTKPECFCYRVFGLPAGKKDVVEKIKEGTKLFLFDFDVKLLYGVYKATCQGQMDLEASAFGGRYPAQVKFSIFKGCIPLPESAFKAVIKDNYQGSKFEPELNAKQVRGLLSLFRSCDVPTAAPVARYPARELPPVVPYAARELPPVARYPARELPPVDRCPARELPQVDPVVYHPHLARHPHPVDPYLLQYNHHVDVVPRVNPPLPVLQQHEYYGSAGTMGVAPPPSDRYYVVENRKSYLPEDSTRYVQDQYPRYGGVQEMVARGVEVMPHNRLPLEGERRSELLQNTGSRLAHGVETMPHHRLSLEGERRSELLQDTVSRYYNPNPTTAIPNSTSQPNSNIYNSYPTSAFPNNSYTPTSSIHHSYHSSSASHAQSFSYPPHSGESVRAEPPRSDRVSSVYSFAGANQIYH